MGGSADRAALVRPSFRVWIARQFMGFGGCYAAATVILPVQGQTDGLILMYVVWSFAVMVVDGASMRR